MDYGSFVISLDFELMWGILDHENPLDYQANIAGVWKAVPEMLRLFEKYEIHATWGVVGMTANRTLEECKRNMPEILPGYEDTNLSAYAHFEELEKYDVKYICAPEMIGWIANTKYQEIGSHTYSHYYCSEKGQTEEAFRSDLKKAREVLAAYSDSVRTLILPRNQLNGDYVGAIGGGRLCELPWE